MVGMIGGLPGNAAPEDEEQDGFGVELTDPRTALAQAKALTNKAYDAKAQMLREARTGPSGWGRLSSALLAAATPARNKTNWDTLRQGLASWTESGEAAREAEEKRRLGLMGLESERNMSLAELEAKYGTKQKASEPKITGGVTANGDAYRKIEYPDGRVRVETAAGVQEFGGPAPQGAAPSKPTPASAAPGGAETFRGPDGKTYMLNAFGKPVEVMGGENRPATAEEARSYGYSRGRFEAGSFKGDEADKLPSAEALNAEIIRDENRREQIAQTLQTARDLIPQVNEMTAGLIGSAARFIPGSAAANLYNTVNDTLGGNIAFDRLQQMRDESKTGGALGQVAVAELDALKGSIASLKQSNGPEQLKANLQKVVYHYERAINAYDRMLADKRARMRGLYGGGGQGGASAAPAPAATPTMRYDPKTKTFQPIK